jgi:hypothetical protein
MKIQENTVVLIAYPQAFKCYEKFERKISKILKNYNRFSIAYVSDHNQFISRYLSSGNRINDVITISIEIEDLTKITHAIIFNDGEFFHLIEKIENAGIQSRIIDIELTKVVNIDQDEKCDVYIGRGSPWGNPHAVGFGASIGEEQNDRSEAIRKYQYDFERGFLRINKEDCQQLIGKTLGCYCKPAACHGDVIADYLNSLDDGK